MIQDDSDLGSPDVFPTIVQAAGYAFQFMAALGVSVALERLSSLAGDALADQRVHIGQRTGAEACLALAIHQKAVQLRTGDDAQSKVQPFLGALFYVADDFHCAASDALIALSRFAISPSYFGFGTSVAVPKVV
ncbi:hypothetical protein D3C75_1080270 [compost metagenome]